MSGVALATEDELSEAMGFRLLQDAVTQLRVDLKLRRRGAGYLRTRMRSWQHMARNGQPIVLLTDLDSTPCAPQLVRNWLGTASRSDNLVLRVAVREIESWLLADHEGMQTLLGKRCRPPRLPDELRDPKKTLLELARNGPRSVREEVVRIDRSIARQGIGYNRCLSEFVATTWSPVRAEARSPSLLRARRRIDELAARLRALKQ